jgi:uncharacterized membrane protein YoaK (UPF0700 family)
MDDVSKLATPLLLPAVLSVIAGSVDVISFLGLDGLFNAHITGNLVIIAAHMVAGRAANTALLLSVPIFILVLALTSLLAGRLERAEVSSLRPLLLLQFLLLTGFLTLCVADRSRTVPNATSVVVAGLLGVSAMAVQNVLVQISLKGAPTTVLTTTITRFTVDAVEVLMVRKVADVTAARRRMKQGWPAIVGFTAGAGLGAASFATAGLWSLLLPTAFALVALAVSASSKLMRL